MRRKIHKYKPGTFEVWICLSSKSFVNIITIDELGRSHFMYSNGTWDDKEWTSMTRREFIEQDLWYEQFRFAGYL